jgi:hypothetical protein
MDQPGTLIWVDDERGRALQSKFRTSIFRNPGRLMIFGPGTWSNLLKERVDFDQGQVSDVDGKVGRPLPEVRCASTGWGRSAFRRRCSAASRGQYSSPGTVAGAGAGRSSPPCRDLWPDSGGPSRFFASHPFDGFAKANW